MLEETFGVRVRQSMFDICSNLISPIQLNPKTYIMEEEQIREALNVHWRASAIGDVNAEHNIYDDNAICDYPQSGEQILGRSNLQAGSFTMKLPGELPLVQRVNLLMNFACTSGGGCNFFLH